MSRRIQQVIPRSLSRGCHSVSRQHLAMCLGLLCLIGVHARAQSETPQQAPTPTQPAEKTAQPAKATPRPSTPRHAPPTTTRKTHPEAIVYFRDGRQVEGQLIHQDTRTVVLRIAGIDTTLDMKTIFKVELVPSVRERYKKLRAVIRDDDVDQLLVLADWLRDRGEYELADKELTGILKIDPANKQAKTLKELVENQIKLAAESKSRSGQPEKETNRPHKPANRRPKFPVLTPDQINLLKAYEVDLSDPPRMRVDRQTVRELIDEYQGNELIPTTPEGKAALEHRPAVRILELMFRLKARKYYGRVEIIDEPKAFKLFRDKVHNAWLINSCATNACHGGQQAGRLWLNNLHRNSQATIYTNFLILDRFKLSDGTPLINYEEPAKSPLLQMALPREQSLYPHPLVATSRSAVWRPVIGSVDDVKFRNAVEWINSMYRPRPEYPIHYTPPVPKGGVPPMPDTPIGDR